MNPTPRFMDITSVTIDEEFQDLIPVHSKEEKNQLEESLIREGCRDALVTWVGILIDGHRRYQICREHNIEFKTVEKNFASREEVKIWILSNQMARRNLTPHQISYLRGKLYNLEKKKATGFDDRDIGQDVPREKTDETLAKKFKISPRTIKRDGNFAEKLDGMPIGDREGVLSGEIKTTKSKITGTVSTTTPLDQLKKWYKKSSQSERDQFIEWINAKGYELE